MQTTVAGWFAYAGDHPGVQRWCACEGRAGQYGVPFQLQASPYARADARPHGPLDSTTRCRKDGK
eukprot:199882-Pyramimonas_sp.AAC.1